MGKFAILALALLLTSACKAPEESHSKAILGAVLIDGFGGPPFTNSIVVTAGDRIRGAGPLSTIPIPAQADKINGGGRFLIPALVTVAPNIQGRDEAALAKAREAGLPAIGRIATLADAEWMLDHGATGFVGMIRDTETLAPEFLAKLRDLRIAVAPALTTAGAQLEVARRNTLRLFQAGVPIALAGEAPDPLREANSWPKPASRLSTSLSPPPAIARLHCTIPTPEPFSPANAPICCCSPPTPAKTSGTSPESRCASSTAKSCTSRGCSPRRSQRLRASASHSTSRNSSQPVTLGELSAS